MDPENAMCQLRCAMLKTPRAIAVVVMFCLLLSSNLSAQTAVGSLRPVKFDKVEIRTTHRRAEKGDTGELIVSRNLIRFTENNGRNEYFSVRSDAVREASYRQISGRRLKLALVSFGVGLFLKGQKHYMTLSFDDGNYMVRTVEFKLDKNNYRGVLREIARVTGVPVEYGQGSVNKDVETSASTPWLGGRAQTTTTTRTSTKRPGSRPQSPVATQAITRNIQPGIAASTQRLESARSGTKIIFPFRNITQQPEDDWIGNGIAETLRTTLAQSDRLSVIMAEGSSPTIETAAAVDKARRLGARWLIDGGYQKIDGQIRITARVIEVDSAKIVETKRIDGRIDDLFTLQDQLVAELMEGAPFALSVDNRSGLAPPVVTTTSSTDRPADVTEPTLQTRSGQGDAEALQTRAAQGDTEAQFMLGSMYTAGTVVEQNNFEAAQWFQRAADQGHGPSFVPLARAFFIGQGVPQDFVSAHLWFNIAAARLSGNDRTVAVESRAQVQAQMSENQLAEAQGLARQWTPTVDRPRTASAQPANRPAGGTELTGRPGFSAVPPGEVIDGAPPPMPPTTIAPRDANGRLNAQTMQQWRLAANQGDADAQTNLGVNYATGDGVPQDYGEAIRWYRRAAEQGNSYAQNNLGVMYRHGNGVRQDHVLAHAWFDLATLNSSGDIQHSAVLFRAQVAQALNNRQIAEARRLTAAWNVGNFTTTLEVSLRIRHRHSFGFSPATLTLGTEFLEFRHPNNTSHDFTVAMARIAQLNSANGWRGSDSMYTLHFSESTNAGDKLTFGVPPASVNNMVKWLQVYAPRATILD